MGIFERARHEFSYTIAEVANRSDSISTPEMRQLAAVMLSCLADFGEVANQIVQSLSLPEVIPGLESGNPQRQRPSCLIIRGLSRLFFSHFNRVMISITC
jgi:hypothetical protein